MLKQVRSWSKDDTANLIASKKVDWSMFERGSQIPIEFYDDFIEANGNEPLKLNEGPNVELIYNGNHYKASLVYYERKNSSGTNLEIRFSHDTELREIIKENFIISYNYIKDNRKENQNTLVHTPDDKAEYIDFYKTDKPYVYRVEFRTKKGQHTDLSFWWVNQGQTYTQEKNGGYLWAPQHSKQGIALPHHVRLLEPKVGDIVFCYSSGEVKSVGVVKNTALEAPKPSEITSDGWQTKGYRMEQTYYDLTPKIRKDEIPEAWRLKENGPFDRNGNVKQGYFFDLSEEFVRKLFDLFPDRFTSEVRAKLIEYKTNHGAAPVSDKKGYFLSKEIIVDHIYNYIKSKGFYYEKVEVINLFLSLKTKPFVILSGISGTGKTKMVQWFAESVGATEENGQFSLIPIRPDWNDGSDLLGYVDIKGEFKEGPLTKVIRLAGGNPELPYFVLLDEMNLARVEYYFSDILSVMESRKWKDGEMISSNLLTEETAGFNLKLPSNVYVVGTVNMDETTHPFSKKVLDRANTIEFNRVNLGNLSFLNESSNMRPVEAKHKTFASKYLHLKDVYTSNQNLVERVTNELVRINAALQKDNAHVGYRVRDEICFYMAYNHEGNLLTFDQAFDHCILQKILPRISGSDTQVEQMLRELYEIFTNKQLDEDIDMLEIDLATAKYPRSAAKVVEMHRRLSDGFTSFWIS
ncbi:McrB family protein [Oceanobacillus saliphilus]|uniref:McrB family protein n=1 Tax=Oceanobacillus saliphilus TaxID=2925834 RepID=UPI00201DDB8F|nr:AAA family ATPase [Oceanobacillus saliphilus]